MGLFDFFKGKKAEQPHDESNLIIEENKISDEIATEDSCCKEKHGENKIENNNQEIISRENEQIISQEIINKNNLDYEDSKEKCTTEILDDESKAELNKTIDAVEKEEILKGQVTINEDEEISLNESADYIVTGNAADEELIGTSVEDNSILEENDVEIRVLNDVDNAEQEKPKKGFFAKLFEGLGKTRKNIMGGVDAVLGAFTVIDEDLFEELEEVLIMADIGVETTMNIIETLRSRVKKERVTDPSSIKSMLIEEISKILKDDNNFVELPSPTVMLVIGVNGVGKTTTIGKLAHNYKAEGKKVILAAADTFRAAAIDQLEVWGKRSNIDVIKHQENSDPAAVVFDAVSAAKSRKADLLICDTAGRLHNKKNLMDELRKISKIIDTQYQNANKEVYLVLDATTGQNALQQAKLFKEVSNITGIILTKLDGTAKGGIVIAIKSELNIPVKFIGVGEGIDDLQRFNSEDFAKALFGNE